MSDELVAGILTKRKWGYHKSTPALLRRCRKWNRDGVIPARIVERLIDEGIEITHTTACFWALGLTDYSKDRPLIGVLRDLICSEEVKLEHRFMDSFTILRKVVAEREAHAMKEAERKAKRGERRSRAQKEAARKARKAQQGKLHARAKIEPAYEPIQALAVEDLW
jgi:hypothetical protein